jgi:ATP-dependent RNA helicase DeaD
LIDIHDLKLGIVFCNTKRMVDDLVDHLNAQGYSADRLHGDMSQAMRDRVMNKFRKSGLEFLVATDVAARGIDVDDVEVVFNYDLPYDGEDYVHRIGRTGRKGRFGRAISFASGREVFQIRNIERYTNVRIQRGKPPTAIEVDEARANAFLDRVRATLRQGEFKRQEHLVERLLEEGFNSTDIASALLHHLQGTEGAAAVKPPEEEHRPFSGDRGDRGDRDFRRSDDRPRRAEPRRNGNGENRVRSEQPKPTASQPPPMKPAIERPAVIAKPPTAPISEPARPITPAPSRAETRPPRPVKPRDFAESAPAALPKHSRRTPDEQTRLYINMGGEMGVGPGDIVGAILGETGLPGKVVGAIDVRERHVFVDVASEHANSIISKLNRTQIKGRKVKAKVA